MMKSNFIVPTALTFFLTLCSTGPTDNEQHSEQRENREIVQIALSLNRECPGGSQCYFNKDGLVEGMHMTYTDSGCSNPIMHQVSDSLSQSVVESIWEAAGKIEDSLLFKNWIIPDLSRYKATITFTDTVGALVWQADSDHPDDDIKALADLLVEHAVW